MEGSLFLTIFVGVSVFVVSQFFLKLILDPIVSFKEALGEVSHLFLFNQAQIINANGSKELQNQLIRASATLLAKKQAIPSYNVFSRLFGLPSETALIKGCGHLNHISYRLNANAHMPSIDTMKSAHAIAINMEMKKIESTLKIRVTYA